MMGLLDGMIKCTTVPITVVYSRAKMSEEINTKSKEQRVIVVKFGAKWCGPCNRSEPDYQNMRKDYNGKPIDFYSVDIENPPPELPRKISNLLQDITTIPLVVVFPPGDGQPTKIKPWKEDDVRLAIESVIIKPSPRKNEYFIRPGTSLSSSEEEALDEYLEGISDKASSEEDNDVEEFDVKK